MNLALLVPMIVLIGLWLLPVLYTLIVIGRRQLDGISPVLWAALIVVAPIFGVLAFWFVNPYSQMAMASGIKVEENGARMWMLFLLAVFAVLALAIPVMLTVLMRVG